MKKSTIITILVVIIVLGLGIWALTMKKSTPPTSDNTQTQQNSDQSQIPSEVPTPTPTPDTSNAGGLNASVVMLSTGTDKTLGTYLTASNGMTLYMYTKDTAGVSNCSGGCATAWPPYTTTNSAVSGGASLTGKVGTITRADGTTQLTYNNEPLYFWSKDTKPGDTTGQNVGGTWFVIKP